MNSSKNSSECLNRACQVIREAIETCQDRQAAVERLRDAIAEQSPRAGDPVDRVKWVPIETVAPNDYNPNAVAKKEMGLLYTSILHDGYTQPVVTIWDQERRQYVIVDGFHRYWVCKTMPDIAKRTGGMLPVVVINKSINDRMAATVRHNRARGEHSVSGMSKLVFDMLDNGWSDSAICNEIGLEAEELLKLKHITGFSALFKNAQYSKAWETRAMIKARKEYERQNSQNGNDL